MVYNIETIKEPDGNWVAKVHSVPGLRVYGWNEEEALATARKLATILLEEGIRRGTRILGFYPRSIPHSTQVAAQPLEQAA